MQAFPRGSWEQEFELAGELGLNCIEWIYDSHGEDVNPIASSAGIERIRELSTAHGVGVRSLCADWLMEHPPFDGQADRWLGRLRWLVGQAAQAEIERIVLPFVDAAAPNSPARLGELIRVVSAGLGAAAEHEVELHLETSLAPEPFAQLLERLDHPLLWVNYDSGNSAALGYDPTEEFAAYAPRIGSFHIKDRVRGGASVPVGTGDAQLGVVFGLLDQAGYSGDAILQAARGEPGAESEWVRSTLEALTREHPRALAWISN